jgi:HEAT repeat protein
VVEHGENNARMTNTEALAGLASRWAWVRAHTMATLPNPPHADHLQTIICIMRSDPSSWVRAGAAYALRSVGDPSLIPALKDALNDSDFYVRTNAVVALGGMDTPAALELICQACDYPCVSVQVAMEAIGAIAMRRPPLDFSRALQVLRQVDTVFDADAATIKSQTLSAVTQAIDRVSGKDLPVPSRPPTTTSSEFPIPSVAAAGEGTATIDQITSLFVKPT